MVSYFIIPPFVLDSSKTSAYVFDAQEKAELIAKHLRGEKASIIAKDEGLDVTNIIKGLIPDQTILTTTT